jgi:hypothetical protein
MIPAAIMWTGWAVDFPLTSRDGPPPGAAPHYRGVRIMRQVYRLLGLVKKWGEERVNQACQTALDAEAVDVNLISRMLERARETANPATTAPPNVIQGRFFRDPSEFAVTNRTRR